ncbi:MAG: hypothetical protein H7X80_06840, partial [bacterium]|nr:hypothetical protein [Candidatus Kapabacteria bacterium]
MGISLKPENLKRYKDLAVLAFKYGGSDMVKTAGLDGLLDEEPPAHPHTNGTEPGESDTEGDDRPHSKAEELADDLERMGP